MPSLPDKIPSLDGLRAVSIGIVLLAHAIQYSNPHGALSWTVLALAKNGNTGVSIFFVISGFLITTLLLREEAKTGRIDQKAFYIRRAFRILPAFLLYLGCVAALNAAHLISVPTSLIVHALTFTSDYASATHWAVAGLWSLSVEEQFYLLWPLLMVCCSRSALTRLAAAVIVLEPAIRIVTRKLFPGTWGAVPYMAHTRADMLMFGCLAALLYQNNEFQRRLQALFSPALPVLCAVFLLVLNPVLQRWSEDRYLPMIGYTLQGLAITFLLLYAIARDKTLSGRLLNHPWVVYIGVRSYSIYLWQQLFMGPSDHSLAIRGLRVISALVLADLSFRAVERPMLKWRAHLTRRKALSKPSHVVAASS